MTQPRVKLTIENFGPIVEGTIEFKPLTFLIGTNNSGKTYVATLLYALSRALRDDLPDRSPFSSTKASQELDLFINERLHLNGDAWSLAQLPATLRTSVQGYLDHQWTEAPRRIEHALRQYFSVADLSGLVRIGQTDTLTMQLVATDSITANSLVSIVTSGGSTKIDVEQPSTAELSALPASTLLRLRADPELGLGPRMLAVHIWRRHVEAYGFLYPHTYYLPAGRSGILQNWPLIASLAVRSVSGVPGGPESSTPPLPGVIGDYLAATIRQLFSTLNEDEDDSIRPEVQPALEILESELIGGRVVAEGVLPNAASMVYESNSLQLPVQRASSMVSELALIDLWVRELLAPNDLIVIDEPEAHLHPQNQRLIARVLGRLANAGIDVVAPTHSSTVLHQVSNMLLASTLDESTRAKLGFSEADRITADDVAVYLFEQREDGVHIVPVPIEPGFGISEDEFVRVAEAIGDETFQLSFAAAHQPA